MKRVMVVVRGCFECPLARFKNGAFGCSASNDKLLPENSTIRNANSIIPDWCPFDDFTDSGVIE